MPDLNVLVLDPPTYSHHFDANCGKIRYASSHKELNDIWWTASLPPVV